LENNSEISGDSFNGSKKRKKYPMEIQKALKVSESGMREGREGYLVRK